MAEAHAAPARRCWFVAPADALAGLVARLPQPLLLGIGRLLAWLLWPVLGKRRRYAQANIDLCFPELTPAQRAQLVRDTLRETVTGALELLRAWYAPASVIRGLYDVQGLEHLQAALDRGQGVLLLSGHFPHSELGARVVGDASGQRVAMVVRGNNDPCMEQLLGGARRRNFQTIDKKDMRGLLQALRGGTVVAYSADQNFTYQSAFVPFFGVQAATLVATPDLATRGRAAVLPCWFQRKPDGRYLLRIEPTWPGWPSGDATADAARYMAELEAVVRDYPAQYLWVHRRFKTRPAGEPDPYA